MRTLEIAGRTLGPGKPCFVIAEAGVNHNGSLTLARQLIDGAKAAGADAVKFQSFRATRLASPAAPKANYQIAATNPDESQLEMLQRLELSEDAHRGLMSYCSERQILFLSSPFDEESADFLDGLGVSAFKIPSGEITNLPLLSHIARKGKPVLLSTGMSTMQEVEKAVAELTGTERVQLALLHCVSCYPAAPADVNLRAMWTLAARFGCPVGYSDHTEGNAVALAAVALGASVLEKHFTLSRHLPGPDHRASIEVAELADLVRGVRAVEAALGDGEKRPGVREADTAAVARKSVVALVDIEEGSVIRADMIGIRRPGTGIPPAEMGSVLGRRARLTIPNGTPIRPEMLS
jgi:N,N'-diacetyllegionaminate synthase